MLTHRHTAAQETSENGKTVGTDRRDSQSNHPMGRSRLSLSKQGFSERCGKGKEPLKVNAWAHVWEIIHSFTD